MTTFELFKTAVITACEYMDEDNKIEYRQKMIELLDTYIAEGKKEHEQNNCM